MSGRFDEAFSQAGEDFFRNKKEIEYLVRGGEVIKVEGIKQRIPEMLDTCCGIDYLVKKPNGQVRGIACRIQEIEDGCNPYDSFTVRLRRDSGTMTEYEKRTQAIQDDALYPFFTVQLYVSKGSRELLSGAACRTKDLFDYVRKHAPDSKHTGDNQFGQASFIICFWRDMQRLGYGLTRIQRIKT